MRNLLGVLSGIFVTSIGVTILKGSEIATGGTAGLALAGSYIFDISFSLIFFLINIPFYIFSYFQMGIKFTLTTIFSVSVLSLFTSIISKSAVFSYSFPAFIGAVIGGGLVGFGLSLLFNNNSSLGGLNIISLYFSKKYNINPGKTTFLFDVIVLSTGFYAVGLISGLYSVLSVAVIGYIISVNRNLPGSASAATRGSHSTATRKTATASST
jgi:uncharacterized membrane-anchored protein YitT (DUF2179 family)